MDIQITHIVAAVVIGLGATVVMDTWAFSQRKIMGIPSLNYCLVGRWLRHMPSGTFKHRSIISSSSKSLECTVGWIAHYAIGVGFALCLVLITSPGWIQQPTLAPALLMGLATVVMPFFVMQPAFGFGIAAAKAPQPNRARFLSLVAHASFGVGLYLAALATSPWVSAYA